jgi:hypothetical protein
MVSVDDSTAINWQQIRSSLKTFDRTATRTALQEVLNRELPPQTLKLDASQGVVPKINEAIADAIVTTAGSWYGVSQLVRSNASIGSWLWVEASTRQQLVEQGAQAVLEQVESQHQFLVDLCDLFDQLPWSNDLETLEEYMKVATEEIVDFIMAETRCNDSWYHNATQAICWFLDDKGIPVSELLHSQLEITIDGSFSSWIEPSQKIQHDVSEVIAFEVFKQEFNRQYP